MTTVVPPPAPQTAHSWPGRLGGGALLFALLLAASGPGFELMLPGTASPLLWPPLGLALGVVVRFGGWTAVPSALAAAAAVYWQGLGLGATALTGFGVAGLLVLSRLLLTRPRRLRPALDTLPDVIHFFGAGVLLAATLHAALQTAAAALTGGRPPEGWEAAFSQRWMGDFVSCLAFAPCLLAWGAPSRVELGARRAFEVLLWLALVLLLGGLIFRNWAPSHTLRYPLELALVPLLAWAGVRFGPRGATVGILLVTLLAVWDLREVAGPAAVRGYSQPPAYLVLFLGIVSTTAFFLAAAVSEMAHREDYLRRQERHLRALLEALPDTAFVVSADGRVAESFIGAESALAPLAPGLVGRHLRQIFPPDKAAYFLDQLELALAQSGVRRFEFALAVNGRELWFEGRMAVLPPPQAAGATEGVLWLNAEISARKAAERALRQRDQLLQGVANAKSKLLQINHLERALGATLESLGEAAGVDRITLVRLVSKGQAGARFAEAFAVWPEGEKDRLAEINADPIELRRDLPGWLERLERGQAIRGFPHDFPERLRSLLEHGRVRSLLVLPVQCDGQLWGTLNFADRQRERAWEESELAAFVSVCDSIGGYLESKQAESLLKAAKEAADQANQAKTEFLALVSHEIRTPMNAVIGFADLLAQGKLERDQAEYIGIIQRSGQSLLELINNILDFSKIESRGLELESTPFEPEHVVMEALELALVRAREKRLKLSYDLADDSGGVFLGDPTRLRQVLVNLVNNAVKFTPRGEVKVILRTGPLDHHTWRLHFTVEDSGIGIPAGRMERLFKAFSQVDSSTTRQYGGTGLGLVICKRLIERMGGEIWAESEEGKGSKFHFTVELPGASGEEVAAISPKDLTDTSISAKLALTHPLRLLVVEDDPTNQRLIAEILRRCGYAPEIVGLGREALLLVQQKPFDCVLLDVQMPDIDGLAVVRAFRQGHAGPAAKTLWVIGVTAFARPEDRERCLRAGMDDYLSKPVAFPALKRALQRAPRAGEAPPPA